MYSDADLESAVSAGVLTAETADAFRGHAAMLRAATPADEEHFRLVTGFNDIFVTIACALVIFASAAVGFDQPDWLGGALVAATSWLMAEIFTRKRRMALPSIVLLLAFVIGLGLAASGVVGEFLPPHEVTHHYVWGDQKETWTTRERYPWEQSLMAVAGALTAALGALLHWRRFRVAITVAAGIGALAVLLLAVIAGAVPERFDTEAVVVPAAFLLGIGIFIYAMRWDFSDLARKTLNADIAFWLHLLAAPMIAHPLFYWMGVTRGDQIGTMAALGVIGIYVIFAVIALAVDRRALLVSALAYVLVALGQLFRTYGAVKLNVALTALVIGTALLALSAFWTAIRSALVGQLPAWLQARVPHGAAKQP